MPQQPQTASPDTLPPDFFDKKTAPDTLPADFKFEEGVQKKTPEQAKASAYKSGAVGSWEPESTAEKIERKAEPYRESVRRTFSSAAQTAGGIAAIPFKVAAAPFHKQDISPGEKKYGLKEGLGPVGRFGQEIEKQVFVPLGQMGEGAKWWKDQLSDPVKRSNLLDTVLEYAPEAIGAGGGAVVAGKAGEAAIPTAGKAYAESYNPVGVKARGIRGIEAVESKIGMTPAEEGPMRAAIDRILDLGEHGADVPPVVKKIDAFMKRASEAKTEKLPDGSVVESEAAPGLTFMDQRKFLSALDQKIDWDSIKGTKMEREMKGLRKTMDVEAIKTAHKGGMAADYVRGKRDYARGMKLESKGRAIGAAVGGVAGVATGAELGKAIGHPFYGAGFGGSVGSTLGGLAGKKVMKGITEAGLGRESIPSEKIASSEIRAEKSGSVQSAKDFGKGGPKGGTPSGGESEIDMILRRANVPDDVKAKVRDVLEKNQQMRKRANAPKGDPNAPPSEIMERAKADYEQKYGKSEKAAEMKAKQDQAIKGVPAPMGTEHMQQHAAAWNKAEKSGKPLSTTLQQAGEIQNPRGEVVSKEDLASLSANFTGEGIREHFKIPEDIKLSSLENLGLIKRNAEGFYEVEGAEGLKNLKRFTKSSPKKLN